MGDTTDNEEATVAAKVDDQLSDLNNKMETPIIESTEKKEELEGGQYEEDESTAAKTVVQQTPRGKNRVGIVNEDLDGPREGGDEPL